MMATFERVHAALTVASDLDAKLEDMSRPFVAEPLDLHTRLLLSDAQIAAKRALKHLLAAVQMAANAEADAMRAGPIAIAAE